MSLCDESQSFARPEAPLDLSGRRERDVAEGFDSFVVDPVEVARFAAKCMPDASYDAPYMVCLAYRKKYALECASKTAWFKKKLVTDAGELPRLLDEFASARGYCDKKTGAPYAPDALVLYATIERSQRRRATKELVKTLIDEDFGGNVEAIFYSKMMKFREKRYIHLDVDDKAVFPDLLGFLDEHKYPVAFAIETRNGFHVALAKNLSKGAGKALYDKAFAYGCVAGTADKVVSYSNGVGVPIPGTLQNGFAVRMVRG